jgi:hypothetical protein
MDLAANFQYMHELVVVTIFEPIHGQSTHCRTSKTCDRGEIPKLAPVKTTLNAGGIMATFRKARRLGMSPTLVIVLFISIFPIFKSCLICIWFFHAMSAITALLF